VFLQEVIMKNTTLVLILALSATNACWAADSAEDALLKTQEKITQEAAAEHTRAAEQLEEAAGHHRRVAAFYKSGKLEDAGWNAYMAYAHELRAQEHIHAAALLHLTEKRNLSDKEAPAEPK
jgi:hypothetical protein